MRKPFWNKKRKQWYVWLGGKQVALGADQDAAEKEWHRRLSLSKPAAEGVAVSVLIEKFLDWNSKNRSADSTAYYKRWLQSFAAKYWTTAAMALRPYDVTQWLDEITINGDGAKRAAIRSVQRALNWAAEQGLIPANTLAKVKKPPEGRREQLLSMDSHKRIQDATDGPFRLFSTAMRHLGCRPKEVRTVTAAQFNEPAAVWVFTRHKTSAKTGKPRAVYLTPCMATLSRILARHRPHGALFRNSAGEPWTSNAVRCRMRRLRKKLELPEGTVSYSYRHTFTTDGLVNGVGIAAMAEVLGHTDTTMIAKHYGHLDQRAEHLREAAAKAAGIHKTSGGS